MVLTKFIVHSASHQANINSSLSLIQNGEKLVHEMAFGVEQTENFSPNFVRTLRIWRTVFLLKFWSSKSETSFTVEV